MSNKLFFFFSFPSQRGVLNSDSSGEKLCITENEVHERLGWFGGLERKCIIDWIEVVFKIYVLSVSHSFDKVYELNNSINHYSKTELQCRELIQWI